MTIVNRVKLSPHETYVANCIIARRKIEKKFGSEFRHSDGVALMDLIYALPSASLRRIAAALDG